MHVFLFTRIQATRALHIFDQVSLNDEASFVENSSFESADGNGLPIVWSYEGDNPGFISGSTGRAYDGSRSLKIYDTSASQDTLARSSPIAVTVGAYYMARTYCYLEGGTNYLYLEFFNSFRHQDRRIP